MTKEQAQQKIQLLIERYNSLTDQEKKMNESFFVQMLKDLTTVGELIRARQDEKQALLDEFDLECKRFFFGKISQKALMASVKKTNNELHRLDTDIREAIRRARSLSDRQMKLVANQAPIGYRAAISGIIGGNKKSKKRKVAKKRKAKRKKR